MINTSKFASKIVTYILTDFHNSFLFISCILKYFRSPTDICDNNKYSGSSISFVMSLVADPGFPRGEGANPKGKSQPIIWPIFLKTAWKFWARGDARDARPLLDPPLVLMTCLSSTHHLASPILRASLSAWFK